MRDLLLGRQRLGGASRPRQVQSTGEQRPRLRHQEQDRRAGSRRRDGQRLALRKVNIEQDVERERRPEQALVIGARAIGQLVDVGGGRGELMMTVLRANPRLRGVVFDQPHVLEPVTVPADLDGRLKLVGGDFFASAPAGADAYLLKHILHDWDDDACRTILRHIRSAMAPGGRVLILEQVIPPGNDPFPGKVADLNMLVMTEGGRERTPGEYALLLESAGLSLRRIHPTAAAMSLVEAVAG